MLNEITVIKRRNIKKHSIDYLYKEHFLVTVVV